MLFETCHIVRWRSIKTKAYLSNLFLLMPALRQSLQRTKVLIDTSTPYQIGGKKHNRVWRKTAPSWRIQYGGKTKNVINVCMHKFACTNVTPKQRNGAHFITHAPYCAWVMNNKSIIEFSFRKIWRILQISEGVIHLSLWPRWITLSSTCRILHILRKLNTIIAKYLERKSHQP